MQLFVDTLHDYASPTSAGDVLINLEADARVVTHHGDFLALRRINVETVNIPREDDGDNVRHALGVTAHSTDPLFEDELIDLERGHLLDHFVRLPSIGVRSSCEPAKYHNVSQKARGWREPRLVYRQIQTCIMTAKNGQRHE
jgi:hypothetical protein